MKVMTNQALFPFVQLGKVILYWASGSFRRDFSVKLRMETLPEWEQWSTRSRRDWMGLLRFDCPIVWLFLLRSIWRPILQIDFLLCYPCNKQSEMNEYVMLCRAFSLLPTNTYSWNLDLPDNPALQALRNSIILRVYCWMKYEKA